MTFHSIRHRRLAQGAAPTNSLSHHSLTVSLTYPSCRPRRTAGHTRCRLPRTKAEARAFDCCVAEWLLRNPVCSSSDRCLECRKSTRTDDPLVAIGVVGAGEAWLHRDCVSAWHSSRIAAAVAALKAMNIVGAQATSQTSSED
jgi:hypothetical protein